MTASAACPICASTRTRDLPEPRHTSLRSDGAIAREPLRKSSCLACASVFRRMGPEVHVAQQAPDYTLNAKDDNTFDAARQHGYASLIVDAVKQPPARVLDMGCGNGALLEALGEAWPACARQGVEPAALPRASAAARGLDVRASPARLPAAELVVSVNVIEHTADPSGFLATISRLLAPGGTCVLVWPADEPANMELLFNDHLFTLPARVMRQLCRRQGLQVSGAPVAPAGFQALVLRKTIPLSTARVSSVARQALDAMRGRAAYLRRWADLDRVLLERLGDDPRVVIGFGMGEAAQALRAHAPGTWARIAGLTADMLQGQRALGCPLVPLDNLRPDKHVLLLVTHPRSQPGLAGRLLAQGFRCVRWDDVIGA